MPFGNMYGGLRAKGMEQQPLLEASGHLKKIYQMFDVNNVPIHLIGLTAPARSGKDTVADILVENFCFNRVAFAKPLKDGLKAMMPFLDETHISGVLKEVILPYIGKSPRYLMQTLGTEWGRQLVKDDIWLYLTQMSIDKYAEEEKSVVVTDVRFENEAKMIRDMGGEVWHIDASARNIQVVNQHASEGGVKFVEGDKRVDNNGTVEELYQKVWEAYFFQN